MSDFVHVLKLLVEGDAFCKECVEIVNEDNEINLRVVTSVFLCFIQSHITYGNLNTQVSRLSWMMKHVFIRKSSISNWKIGFKLWCCIRWYISSVSYIPCDYQELGFDGNS